MNAWSWRVLSLLQGAPATLVIFELEEIDMTLQAERQAKSLSAWSILLKLAVKSTTKQTGINGGMQIWNLLWAIAGAVLADRVGRRTLWRTSFFCMILANVPLTICSAIYDQHGSKPVAYLVIVFLFFYSAAFNIANNPLLEAGLMTAHMDEKMAPVKEVGF